MCGIFLFRLLVIHSIFLLGFRGDRGTTHSSTSGVRENAVKRLLWRLGVVLASGFELFVLHELLAKRVFCPRSFVFTFEVDASGDLCN